MTKKNTIPCGKCKNWKSCFVLASGNRRCEFGGNITDQFTIKPDCRMAIEIKG